jgi:hypothetical protein
MSDHLLDRIAMSTAVHVKARRMPSIFVGATQVATGIEHHAFPTCRDLRHSQKFLAQHD